MAKSAGRPTAVRADVLAARIYTNYLAEQWVVEESERVCASQNKELCPYLANFALDAAANFMQQLARRDPATCLPLPHLDGLPLDEGDPDTLPLSGAD